jgi:hypothetical protein
MYSYDADYMINKFVHLTNFSINKWNLKNYKLKDKKKRKFT